MSWIAETLIASTLLMVAVLLVRAPVARIFGPRIAYMLWLLPALRMVLPPIPETVADVPSSHLPQMLDLAVLEMPVDMIALAEAPVQGTGGVDWLTLVLAVWLTGALAYFAWHLVAYHRFVRTALGNALQLPELDRHGIEVCASKAVDGPVATGVLLQRIVLPFDWRTRYDATELRLAMLHETAHHRRGDLSVNYLALAMLSLHWFNPVAHRAWRAFRADQELACDAIVLAGAGGDAKHSYGLALVKSACSRTPVAVCALNPRDQLKLRLRMMREVSAPGVGSRALAVALIGSGLGLTASGGLAADTTRDIVADQVEAIETAIPASANIAAIATPAVPAPPAVADHAGAVPAPIAPLPPVANADPAQPPVPPVPPMPPVAPDLREAHAAIREARAAHADAERHVAEAMRVAHAQARLADAQARIVTRSVKISASADCKGSARAMVTTDGTGAVIDRTEYCLPDRAQIRRQTLDALKEVRSDLDADRAMDATARRQAVASIDAQIARLSADAKRW